MPILITGATGFVGRELLAQLVAAGLPVRAALHQPAAVPPAWNPVTIGNIDAHTDWSPALRDVDIVVHLAARVHQLHDTATDPLAAFRRINTEGSRHLFISAARAGVRRVVFVSTIKVLGESSGTTPFTECTAPAPTDPYAQSKWEAEEALRRCAAIETVIVRPPLIYGPGVKANFLALTRAVARGWPLPFGAVHNRRSFVGVRNFASALVACVRHPAAAHQTFLVSDQDDLSTPELLRRIGAALQKPARLLPIPVPLLMLAARLTGRRPELSRLCGNCAVNADHLAATLQWRPPHSVDAELQPLARWFRAGQPAPTHATMPAP